MVDQVIKGDGNSRYLKSVANFIDLYPTYEDFVQALVDGELPIDLNGLNSAGIEVDGTPLNKANLLTDAMAELLGGDGSMTPTQALLALHNQKAKKSIAREVTLEIEDWELSSGVYVQRVAVDGVTADNNILVTYNPESFLDWTYNELRCTSQENGYITISASFLPTSQILANIIIMG